MAEVFGISNLLINDPAGQGGQRPLNLVFGSSCPPAFPEADKSDIHLLGHR